MKMAIIYHLMLGKLMLVAPHFVSIAINLELKVNNRYKMRQYGNTGKKLIQARKIYSSMLRNQQNTCLVKRTIYRPHSYHFIGGSLQLIQQVRLVPLLLWHVSVQCLMV